MVSDGHKPATNTVADNTPGVGPGLFEMPPGVGDIINYRGTEYVIDGFTQFGPDAQGKLDTAQCVMLRRRHGFGEGVTRFPISVLDDVERVDLDETKPPAPSEDHSAQDTREVEGVESLPGEQVKTLIQVLLPIDSFEGLDRQDQQIEALLADGYILANENVVAANGKIVRVMRFVKPFAVPEYRQLGKMYQKLMGLIVEYDEMMRKIEGRM